jgi:hypothetical protein
MQVQKQLTEIAQDLMLFTKWCAKHGLFFEMETINPASASIDACSLYCFIKNGTKLL